MKWLNPSDTFQTPPDLADDAKWYCLISEPMRQVRAQLELYGLGYVTFLPKARRWVSHARQKVAKEKPLLNRYLFVAIGPGQPLGPVLMARSVETMICSRAADGGVTPVPFPSRWVETMRQRQMSGEWDEVAKNPLPVGARIRIVEGEFAEMLAIVTNRKGSRIDFKVFDSVKTGRLHACSVRAA